MFVSKYNITNRILKNIGIIEAAKEVITNAPLVPAWEAKFRKEAMERSIHHGTHLEGNPLSEEEVKFVLVHELLHAALGHIWRTEKNRKDIGS